MASMLFATLQPNIPLLAGPTTMKGQALETAAMQARECLNHRACFSGFKYRPPAHPFARSGILP